MSILDDEIDLIKETNPLNENFPEFSNSHENENGGYYAFYNKYFLPDDDKENERCLIIDYAERFSHYRSKGYEISILIGIKDKYYWHSIPADYIYNSELELFEDDLKHRCYTPYKLTSFKDRGKTKTQAKIKAYKILEELKNNPNKLYKLMDMDKDIPNIKYNLFRLKNL